MPKEHLPEIELNKISTVMAPTNAATASLGVRRAILKMGMCRTNGGGLSIIGDVGLMAVPRRVVSTATSPACPPLRVSLLGPAFLFVASSAGTSAVVL